MDQQGKNLDPCMGLGRIGCTILAGLLAVIGFAFALNQEVEDYHIHTELHDYGTPTVGKVTVRHFEAGSCDESGCSDDRYWADYTFKASGHVFTGATEANDRYRDSKEGDAVNVLYLAGNPSIHRIAEENLFSLPNSIILVLSGPLFGVTLGFPIIWTLVYLVIFPVFRRANRFRTR